MDIESKMLYPLAFQGHIAEPVWYSLTKYLCGKILYTFGYLYVMKWNKFLSFRSISIEKCDFFFFLGSLHCKDDCFKRIKYEPRHDKTNKMSVRPAKTQISLGIRPVWSESWLCAHWVAKADLSLHWAPTYFVGFFMKWLIYTAWLENTFEYHSVLNSLSVLCSLVKYDYNSLVFQLFTTHDIFIVQDFNVFIQSLSFKKNFKNNVATCSSNLEETHFYTLALCF